MARAVRFQGCITTKFWGKCVLAIVYIIIRLPTMVLGDKSPYEVFHGKSPQLDHFKVVGCLCYGKKMNNHDKFDFRAIPSVFMGYFEVT